MHGTMNKKKSDDIAVHVREALNILFVDSLLIILRIRKLTLSYCTNITYSLSLLIIYL